ncbi:MAG: hypothetical protein IPN31_01805 [Bacteroidetes bacterium]|nr:hypothetical protein [Bacteroidota bacterium]
MHAYRDRCKTYFHNATGLGNGNRTLIQMLIDHHPEHDYVLFTNGIKINPHIRGNSKCLNIQAHSKACGAAEELQRI